MSSLGALRMFSSCLANEIKCMFSICKNHTTWRNTKNLEQSKYVQNSTNVLMRKYYDAIFATTPQLGLWPLVPLHPPPATHSNQPQCNEKILLKKIVSGLLWPKRKLSSKFHQEPFGDQSVCQWGFAFIYKEDFLSTVRTLW